MFNILMFLFSFAGRRELVSRRAPTLGMRGSPGRLGATSGEDSGQASLPEDGGKDSLPGMNGKNRGTGVGHGVALTPEESNLVQSLVYRNVWLGLDINNVIWAVS